MLWNDEAKADLWNALKQHAKCVLSIEMGRSKLMCNSVDIRNH